jgi:NAD(P) transhydrogenase subunit alpha
MIKPVNVLVIGTGVGGLQAVATAKRLGAIVHATDIRPDAAEQAKSLGAK